MVGAACHRRLTRCVSLETNPVGLRSFGRVKARGGAFFLDRARAVYPKTIRFPSGSIATYPRWTSSWGPPTGKSRTGIKTPWPEKTSKVRVSVKASLSRRLRDIRQELFGDHGGPELARRLNLPARTMSPDQGDGAGRGVARLHRPHRALGPLWLLSGEGPSRTRERPGGSSVLADLSPIELIRRGLEKLEQEPTDAVFVALENPPNEMMSDFVAIRPRPPGRADAA